MEEKGRGSSQADTQQVVYTAKAHTLGGRDGGTSRTSDGRLNVKLSRPDGPGEGTNPEQLFAVGWSSCFLSALKLEAATRRIRLPVEVAVDAEVDLCSSDEGYTLQARLKVSLPGIDREAANAIAAGAHLLCPYSKAVHGNIKVETIVL